MHQSTTIAQIRTDSLIIYSEPLLQHGKAKSLIRSNNLREKRKERYKGKITEGAKKRLTKAVNLLVQSSAGQWIENPITKRLHYHRLSFITLTVSTSEQNLTARQAYDRLFVHFLQWLRRTKKVSTYVWKAELQKRGQIHYHITCPDWIHWQEIRDKWNNLQRAAGITDSYYREHGHYDPNSTDIHAVKGIDKLAGYLVKYMTKENEADETTDGKVWDCSENLKKAKYFTVEMNENKREYIRKELRAGRIKQRIGDRFAIISFRKNDVKEVLNQQEKELFRAHMQHIRDNTTPPPPVPLPIPPHLLPQERHIPTPKGRKRVLTDYSKTLQYLSFP